MAVKIKTRYGDIDISNDVIATVVGGAATDIYGIVGMASKNQIRDNLNTILKHENYSRGVVVRQEADQIVVNIYIIISYGVKLSEVGRNVQDNVKYNLQSMLGIDAEAVNIFVQGVKVTEDLD
ncbi:Asp23/Gls24 family envelope stress response protein [Agrilactobacillus yilanensis]|uniref:Asp23/Gls24 family envelope stress response protein n=1 Tax=Agrilactobacillus yilanensis TaxID=2485997 RepID=A0ABW4JB15_9LACO|nr:Asp23/Gls24 family envelope stress response protein [Agrilactobacillus yilanensis]